MQSNTRIQFLQNGYLHSVQIPGVHNARQTERLQEFAQNTALGTTNLMSSMGDDTVDLLRNYHSVPEIMVGGLFNGLTEGEAQWLREQGWTEERQWFAPELSEGENGFLCTQNALKFRFVSEPAAPVESTTQLRVDHTPQRGTEMMNPKADSATLADLVNSSEPLPTIPTIVRPVGVIGDGRPSSFCTQQPASIFTPLDVANPSDPDSSVSPAQASTLEEPVKSDNTRPTSPSVSPRAKLAPIFIPKDEAEACMLQDATFHHFSIHGWPCYFDCNYNPLSGRYEYPAHWLQAPTPPDSPISDISDSDSDGDDSCVFYDWGDEDLNGWVQSQQEDLEMACLPW